MAAVKYSLEELIYDLTRLVEEQSDQAKIFDIGSAYLKRILDHPDAIPAEYRVPSGQGRRPNHGSYLLHQGASGLSITASNAIAVTGVDGLNATLAGATLVELGYRNVSVLDGGMKAWQQASLPVERGLSGLMAPPTDLVPSGPDRNYADMMNYLRWEEALGRKYQSTDT